LGVTFHILRQIVRIIAYFTYSGLLYLEPIVKLELFIPEKGTKRLVMDLCATILTGIAVQGVLVFVKHSNETFIYDLPQNIPIFYAIIGIICVGIIYFLGYKSNPKVDEKEEWFDKLDKLITPIFLKFW
jgi:hypothetical protein